MNAEALLELPAPVHQELLRHLLREPNGNEEAAFVFAKYRAEDSRFRFIEWLAVPPDGFAVQLPYYFELTDETRTWIIKRAHDLGASVIEFHSHTGPWPAQFSPSDWSGFEEVVPHVWWRLKGRPYAAVVIARTGFDGFAWLTGPSTPTRLGGIDVGGQLLEPSRLSPLERNDYDWKV
jgi:proteasome lid subunit RPN8/RPN11